MSNLALETSIPTKTSLSDFTGSFREVLGESGCPTLRIRARGPGICSGCFRKSTRRPTLPRGLPDLRANGLSCRLSSSRSFALWGERSPALLGEARGDRGLVSESEPSPRKIHGHGEAERSERGGAGRGEPKGRANPFRVSMSDRHVFFCRRLRSIFTANTAAASRTTTRMPYSERRAQLTTWSMCSPKPQAR